MEASGDIDGDTIGEAMGLAEGLAVAEGTVVGAGLAAHPVASSAKVSTNETIISDFFKEFASFPAYFEPPSAISYMSLFLWVAKDEVTLYNGIESWEGVPFT